MRNIGAAAFIFIIICFGFDSHCFSQRRSAGDLIPAIDGEVVKLMKAGHIPGLSVVFELDGKEVIRSYGYRDVDSKLPVTPTTLFQLGSCSKAFTALAAERLIQSDSLSPEAPVSDYLPWFHSFYRDSPVSITILQLLHHTSGIPWQTISEIPQGDDDNALEQTVKKIANVKLRTLPGRRYEYATINYDIIALIIQKITHQSFETYLKDNVLNILQLHNTEIGAPIDSGLMAKGYKIGFLRPRLYNAPVYKANNAAGYVISDAVDMGKWLRFQMGSGDKQMYGLAQATHQRDETVPVHDMSSYAMGWQVSLSGNGEINHSGLNPNFTSYIAIRPKNGTGVVVLANSNSNYTSVIGDRLMKLLNGERMGKEYDPGDGNDKAYSLVCLVLGIYTLAIFILLGRMVSDIARGKRRYERPSRTKLQRFALSLLLAAPFLYGVYILPTAIAGFTWKSIFVWTPVSFEYMIIASLCALAISYLTSLAGLLFPPKNDLRKKLLQMVLMSVLSGIANMLVIILVTSTLDTGLRLRYVLFYYLLASSVFLFGRRFVQINLVKLTRGMIYDLRVELIEKIFLTSYQKFEKLDRGRIYTALNDDVETIGGSADQFIMLITSAFTVLGAVVYLVSIDLWIALVVVLLIGTISSFYFFVSRSSVGYFEKARDTRNVFYVLVNGMVDGFKEISLHRRKRKEYKSDMIYTAGEYKTKISIANIRFANAFLVGESMLILLLGLIVFAIPRMFLNLGTATIMSFVIVVLYLIGPFNSILNAIPALMQLRIAWRRIQKFLKEIPANINPEKTIKPRNSDVCRIVAHDITFQYPNGHQQTAYKVGPVNLEVRKGEILFIVGRNGSGKTTLAKLLTGMYVPDMGEIMINDRAVESEELSEYFSVVFNPAYLFQRLYGISTERMPEAIDEYLRILGLNEKVEIRENHFSTIELSGGQRKRLALLQCYLEDAPIYLFDEWAADQDPEYRHFFYRTLLPEMKRQGKIIIAISHDDHYYDVADKILELEHGTAKVFASKHPGTTVTL